MLPSKRLAIALVLTLGLAGCSYFQFPGVHKVRVQQGNIITQDMVDQLRPGMSKSQVRFIMGTPLIADTFHQDRWDYFYSLDKGDDDEVRERVTVFFDNDKVSGLQGDYLPSGAASPRPENDREEAE
jgi:outer membrane protein assembly factor BamE